MTSNVDRASLALTAGDARIANPDRHAVGDRRHLVEFYESGDMLARTVAAFIGDGLRAGGGAVVIATRAHRDALEDRLRHSGLDLATALDDGRYLSIDAETSLASVMIDGLPDRDAFLRFAGDVITRATAGCQPVRVYGEWVALLAHAGHDDALIALERLWNELAESLPFTLLCGYPIDGLVGGSRTALIDQICAAHDGVIAAEGSGSRSDAVDRSRAIARLQQKAASLEAEIVERARIEQLLATQSRVLEMIARRSPLPETLSVLIRTLEEQDAKWCASILVRALDEDRFCMGIAPSMPDGYIDVIADGSILAPYRSPCCQAAHCGKPVITADASTDERWPAAWRHLAVSRGLLTCFSFPIVASNGEVLGTFTTYDRVPRDTRPPVADLVETATHLAAIAIERSREEAEHARLLAQADEARAEAEQLYRVGQMLAAELDQEKLLQAITDTATSLCGAEDGAFYDNTMDEHRESHLRGAQSGAPREERAALPMPRNSELFQVTLGGGKIVRLADVTQDPRFAADAPYYGRQDAPLPLASYLAVPITARSGEVLGGLFFGHRQPGVFTERSERMVAGLAAAAAIAIENARLYQQVHQAVRFRDDFLAAVAHDLKTPLTSIKGRAQLVLRQLRRLSLTGAERLEEGLANIDLTVSAMQEQLDELLDLTRLEIGHQIELQRSPTDLVALAHRVADVQLFTKQHLLRVESSLSELIGEWDESRLARVVGNLLSNAIKYSPPGSEVVITIERAENDAVLAISDKGIGIPKEDQARIFDRFQRGRNVPGHAAGTGIGLASVRQVVEQHGGSISLWSEEGAGSTFTVRLPLTMETARDAEVDQTAPGREKARS